MKKSKIGYKKESTAIIALVFLVLIASSFALEGVEDIVRWNQSFDSGVPNTDVAYDVAIDSQRNVFIVGYTRDTDANWWIKKFNNDGVDNTTHWNRTFDGNSLDDEAYGVDIDSNGEVYVVGYSANLVSGSSGADWWIKKFDINGTENTTHWNKSFDNGDGSDVAYDVAIDSSSNVYVIGTGDNLLNTTSGQDWWIKKFDSNGTEDIINWNKSFGTGGSDRPNSIYINQNDDVFIAGYGNDLFNSSTNADWWIKRFDSGGNENTTHWNKTIHLSTTDLAETITGDNLGNIYVGGAGVNLYNSTSQGDWLIKKFDSNGTEDLTNWNKVFDGIGSADTVNVIRTNQNNDVFVAGYGINIVTTTSSQDWWVKKFNSEGIEVNTTEGWNKTINGAGADSIESIFVEEKGNITLVGFGSNLVTASSGQDWWIKRIQSFSSTCQYLNSDYTVYNNVNSSTTCFTINASNIRINCQNYNITYGIAGTEAYGINNTPGVQNITIENCNFVEGNSSGSSKHAIFLTDTTNSTVYNNTIITSGAISSPVYITSFNHNNTHNITRNILFAKNNSAHTINLNNTRNATIANNNIIQFGTNSAGINFIIGGNNSVENNNITANNTNALLINENSSNNYIISNNITVTQAGSTAAIQNFRGDNTTIFNNLILISGPSTSSNAIAISQRTLSTNISSNNITTFNSTGILLGLSSNYTHIAGNRITVDSDLASNSIATSYSNNVIVESNIINSNNGSAIFLGGAGASFNNTVKNNNITITGSSSYGIRLLLGRNYQFFNNNITSNYYEIFSQFTVNSTFFYNNSFGEIKWLNQTFLDNLTINITNPYGIGLGRNLFIGNNTAALNTSAFMNPIYVNTSANITLRALTLSSVQEIRRLNTYNITSAEIVDSGTNCLGSTCQSLSFAGGVLVFNTTSFSSFAGTQSVTLACGYVNNDITLVQNISSATTCFTINASNVVVDCDGHSIIYGTSGADNSYGINKTTTFFENVTIQNCNIHENNRTAYDNHGLDFSESNNFTIHNNTIYTYSNNAGGIVYEQANSGELHNISNNRIHYNGSSLYAIELNAFANSTISDNRIFTRISSGGGIHLEGSVAVDILRNSLNNTGIFLENSDFDVIEFNNITHSSISLSQSSYNNVSYNNVSTARSLTVVSTTGTPGGGGGQALISNLQLPSMFNNFSFNNFKSGFRTVSIGGYSNNTLLYGNNISGNGTSFYGVWSVGPHINGLKIINNEIRGKNGGGGIIIFGRNYTIQNNNITLINGTQGGIRLHFGVDNKLINNNITAFNDYEIIETNFGTGNSTIIYNNSFGEIKWTNYSFLENITINISDTLGLGNTFFIGNNTIAVNTSHFYPTGHQINSSANITLTRLGLASVNQIYRVENFTTVSADILNSGSNCNGNTCQLLSYNTVTDTLLFNTTTFSSFSGFDVSNPLVTITSPGNRSNFSSGNQAFTASIFETSPDTVIFVFNNATGNQFNVTPTNTSGSWSANVNIDRFIQSNEHIMTVFVNDTSNSINYSQSVYFTVDRGSPNVTLLNVSFNTTDTTPDIWVNVTDNFSAMVDCDLYFNGTLSASLNLTNATPTAITASTLTAGHYVAWVNCTDFSGNLGNSTNITVIITGAAVNNNNAGGGGGGGSSSSGGGSLPPEPTDTTVSTPDSEDDGLTAELIDEKETTDSEDPLLEGTEVTVRFTNRGSRDIMVKPDLKGIIPDPNLLKKLDLDRAVEIELIDRNNVGFMTGKVKDFGDGVCGTTSGISYSSSLVAAEPLKNKLINQEEFIVPAKSTVDKVFEIESGISERTDDIVMVFTTDTGTTFEQAIQQTEKTGIGSVLDIDPELGKIDIYMKVPTISRTSEKYRNYQLEVAINKRANSRFQPWKTKIPFKLSLARSTLQTIWGEQTVFGEIYGPHEVQEKQSSIFAQQLNYQRECYNGDFIVNTKVYQNNEVLVEDSFNVNFETGVISGINRQYTSKAVGNQLTGAAIIDSGNLNINFLALIALIFIVASLMFTLHYAFKNKKISHKERQKKIDSLRDLSSQKEILQYKNNHWKKKDKEPEARLQSLKQELKDMRSAPEKVLRDRPVTITDEVLERNLQQVNRKLHGYDKPKKAKPQVLTMPARTEALNNELQKVQDKLSSLQGMKLQKTRVRTTLPAPPENKSTIHDLVNKKELSFINKKSTEPLHPLPKKMPSDEERVAEHLARKEVERISQKVTGKRFKVNNERIIVEEKLKKLKSKFRK